MFDPRNPSGEKRIDNRVPGITNQPTTEIPERIDRVVSGVPDPANGIEQIAAGYKKNPAVPVSNQEPLLMPNQKEPFNGDYFVAKEFLKLAEAYNIETIIELGTCVGGSTKWMAENYDQVHSIEINESFLGFAKQHCAEAKNIEFYLGSTVDMLAGVLQKCTPPSVGDNVMIFIDSHWNTLPIFDELKIIKASGLKPVIAIHDFLVPEEPSLGFDSYKGVDISFENIKSYIDDIYGGQAGVEYDYYYNTDATSTSIKRGLIYIYPKY